MLPAGPRSGDAVSPVILTAALSGCEEVFQNAAVRSRIAHDATSPHLAAAYLELGLDESDDPTAVVQRFRAAGKTRLRPMNETSIVTRSTAPAMFEMTNIRPLDDHDTRIGPQPARQLPVANIDRINPRGAALQQTIGEPARTRAKVGRNESRTSMPNRSAHDRASRHRGSRISAAF